MPEPGLSKRLRPAHFGPMVLMTMSPLAAVDPQVGVEEEASIPSADSSSNKASCHRNTGQSHQQHQTPFCVLITLIWWSNLSSLWFACVFAFLWSLMNPVLQVKNRHAINLYRIQLFWSQPENFCSFFKQHFMRQRIIVKNKYFWIIQLNMCMNVFNLKFFNFWFWYYSCSCF